MTNRAIAEALMTHAHTLDGQAGQLYRARAYRRAALMIQGFERPLADCIATEGMGLLGTLPGIGKHLAYTITTLAQTGEWRTWDERPRRRLRAG